MHLHKHKYKNPRVRLMDLQPKEIINELDGYIIGQSEAKKAVAIAVRNRYRRLQLSSEEQEFITPKNIMMIGQTGVGKTEIARQLARLLNIPFIKVEASKYTEVGFVGRDVESMVRDLVSVSINLTRKLHKEKYSKEIEDYILDLLAKKLLPELPKSVSDEKKAEYQKSFDKIKQAIKEGKKDKLKVKIDIAEPELSTPESGHMPAELMKMQESLMKILKPNKKENKEVSIKEARELLRVEAEESILDEHKIIAKGLENAQNNGIIFIDEIDKIATKSTARQDPSKEGVQRDLLPIIEGSEVHTKYGIIKTDFILFISAGAFAISRPSDLIPELQGRFPIRVELEALDEEALFCILTQTKHSLIRQYELLLGVEGVGLAFEEDALRKIASIAYHANAKTEDIGARRLVTVIEMVLEDVSFNASSYKGKIYSVDAPYVEKTLEHIIENIDLARYIL